MALIKNLIPGNTYRIRPNGGEFANEEVRILSTEVEMDPSSINCRKIPVEIIRHGEVETAWVLPRIIDDGVPTPNQRLAQVLAQAERPAAERLAEVEAIAAPEQAAAFVQPRTAPVIEADPITDINDPRLDAYRVDTDVNGPAAQALLKSYVSRKLPGGRTDIEVLAHFYEARQNILLVGDTQAGKSMLIRVLSVLLAKAQGLPKPLPVFTLSGSNGITDFDLFGQTTAWVNPATGEEQLVWLPGVVAMAARVGGILELDEIAMMGERVTSSLHSLCDDRRQFVNRGHAVKLEGDGFAPEIIQANPNLWIVGAYNDGYRGSGSLQEAFTNRFRHLRWDYDQKVEEKLIPSQVVRAIGQACRSARENHELMTPVGTKALQNLFRDATEVGVEFALWAFCGIFPARERGAAEAIIRDRDFERLLTEEVAALANPEPDA